MYWASLIAESSCEFGVFRTYGLGPAAVDIGFRGSGLWVWGLTVNPEPSTRRLGHVRAGFVIC